MPLQKEKAIICRSIQVSNTFPSHTHNVFSYNQLQQEY